MRKLGLYLLVCIATLTAPTTGASAADEDPLPSAQQVEDLVLKARKGQAHAQYQLARAYELGRGTRQSYAEAVKWYRAAANQGLPRAQFNLALIYEEGRGDVKRDVAYALSWYEEAARNGLKSALERLQSLTTSKSITN